MKALKYGWLLAGFLLLLLGCQKELPPVDYVHWVKDTDNGLYKTKTVNDIKAAALYKPHSYVIANELRKTTIPQQEYEQRFDELKDMQYFDFKLGLANGGDILEYQISSEADQQARLYYMSYAMQNDFYLLDGSDTLTCKLYHFERSYDLGSYKSFVLGFPLGENTTVNDKTLVFDSPYWGTGPLKIKFSKEAIQNIPPLKLEL